MPQTTTAERAVDLVKPGDRIVVGGLSAEPRALLAALAGRGETLPDLTVLSGMLLSDYEFLDGRLPRLSYRTWFMPASLGGQRLSPEAVEFLPTSWARTVLEFEERPADVALVQVSPPDRHGWCSLGVSVSYVLPAMRRARTVIAEVNPQMPRTMGRSLVHESQIAAFVPVDRPLPEFPHGRQSETGRTIARLATELIPDGVTVQPGIGALPGQVLTALAERQAVVRVHSILTDAGIELVRCNVAEDWVALVGEVVGSRELYDFVDQNQAVHMAPAEQTHGARALTELGPFVSVNSALEVDLFGQVNLEYLDGSQAGGVGGSLDFMAAAMQPGNLSILVMRSSAAGGSVSRIRPMLAGAPVSIPRTLTQVLVTEYGVADLRGCTVQERAQRLAAVAHPDHRPELEREWQRMR